MSVEATFKEQVEFYEKEEARLKKQSNALSTIRLVEFLSGAGLAVLFFAKAFSFLSKSASNAHVDFDRLSTALGYGVSLLTLMVFVFLVKRHNKVEALIQKARAKRIINQEYLDRLDGKWVSFKDKGEEWYNTGHAYAADLDIFGEKSLFQWLNTAKTHYGRERLKVILEETTKNTADIKERQEAVRELSGMLKFCQDVQCEGMLHSGVGKNPEELIRQAEDDKKLFKAKWMENIFYILPAVTLLTLVFSSLGLIPIPLLVPVLMLIVQYIIGLSGNRRLFQVFDTVARFKKELLVYGSIIHLLEDQHFKSGLLVKLKEKLKSQEKKASAQIKKLEKIAEAMDVRYSPLPHFFVNILLMWDYHCLFAYEEWNQKNGASIGLWLKAIGEFESLMSLSVPTQVEPEWCFPNVSAGGLAVSSQQMGHPLIQKEKRVCNDINIDDQLCIVTGSNMSGKTTLLRTIGINLVLAYAGAPVCAGQFDCSIMDVVTSMRINDDLNAGISTFYAELLRIKLIIDRSREKHSMIFLIDEIFRGTNSRDRIEGAISVLKALNQRWIIGLISTHDYELCELETQGNGRILNYHFSESYANSQIHFDYKLRPGRSTATNARYLMKMVGIE